MARSFIASSPLVAEIARVTPQGGYVATGFERDLGEIVAGCGALAGPLVIAVDTLVLPEGETRIAAQAVSITARCLQVKGSGSAVLVLDGDDMGLQLLTAQVQGSISVSFKGSADPAMPLSLQGVLVPQVLLVSPSGITCATDKASVADAVFSPWSRLSLEVAGAVAAALLDDGTTDALSLASPMLRWVIANCQALLSQKSSYPAVDWSSVGSQLGAALGLLTIVETAASGATWVPVLSGDFYEKQIHALLAVAQTYDEKISSLQQSQDVKAELSKLATTLGDIQQGAEIPLLDTLKNLASETELLETQLGNAKGQLDQILPTLKQLQETLLNNIKAKETRDLIFGIVKDFLMAGTLYVGVATAIVDPEGLAGEAEAALKTALDVTQQFLEKGESLVDKIKEYLSRTVQPEKAVPGAQVQAAAMVKFGQALDALWVLIDKAIAGADQPNDSPDLASLLEKQPDLSGFTLGGVDPVTYWKAIVFQTRTYVEPYKGISGAAEYLQAVELCATYGSAVGDLQMKLYDLYTRGVSTFSRLQAARSAADRWQRLETSLGQEEKQVAAAIGLLQGGYIDVKRSLVLAIENYRAAFAYTWLSASQIHADVTMDYTALSAAAEGSIADLGNVLVGTGDTVRPRQTFDDVEYTLKPAFFEAGGAWQAQGSITLEDGLSTQVNATALFLTKATFELQGTAQDEEVELEISTSGRYENQLDGQTFRFVSQAVLMNNNYRPSDPPDFIAKWSFGDPNAYMAPTPYTTWTVKIVKGSCDDKTTIKMTLAGLFLQNAE